jgi:hypothetical protein
LLPFSLRNWAVLGVVAFFVSGTTGFNLNFNLGTGDVSGGGTAPLPGSGFVEGLAVVGGSPRLVLALLIGAIVLLALLVLWYVAAVMEFVLVDIATEQDVRLRGFVGASTRKGLSLFGLRLALALITIAGVVLFAILAAVGNLALLVAGLLLLPVVVLLAIGLWLVSRLTTDFVVPVMIAEDTGVVQGWRTVWPALRADWKQYGVYVLLRLLLGAVAALVVGIGFTVIGLVLVIPFVIVGVVVGVLLTSVLGATAVGVALVAVLALLFVVLLVVVGTVLIQVPVQTYLRYYSLFVLGATTPEYDLLEDVRSSIASGDGSPPSSEDATSPNESPPAEESPSSDEPTSTDEE